MSAITSRTPGTRLPGGRFESQLDPATPTPPILAVVDLGRIEDELNAWAEWNGAANLRPAHVLDLLRQVATPVEQAEDEAAGYTEHDTGAFIGHRRARYVGGWETA